MSCGMFCQIREREREREMWYVLSEKRERKKLLSFIISNIAGYTIHVSAGQLFAILRSRQTQQ